MATDISIAISAKDNFTDTITKIRNAQTPFRKDLTELNKELTKLSNTKVNLKVDLSKAKSELKAAEKAFQGTASEANRLNLAAKQANYDNLKSNLDAVSKSARQAQKDIEAATSASIKSRNRAGIGQIIKENGGLGASLAKAGALEMVGQTASNAAVTLIGSASGENAGIMAGSVLSGAGSGAAIGSMFGPAGTAVGAIGGAIVGMIDGATQIFEKEDDAFKSVVKERYQARKEEEQANLSSGIETASNREQRQISFTTLLGGDFALAESYLADMTRFAAKTPFGYDQLAEMSKTLLAYNYSVDELLPLMTKIGDAGSALGLSAEDMNMVATYLGRMNTTGKTTMEYLNPLLERGIPVFDYLAQASGKTKTEIQEMVSRGLIPGEEAAAAIADYMGQDFTGNMEIQSKTYAGLMSTLQDQEESNNAAMGKGYEDTMKPYLDAKSSFLEENSALMEEYMYEQGQLQAEIEKGMDSAITAARIKAMEETEGMDPAERAIRVAEAEEAARTAYMQTEGYQAYQDTEKKKIEAMQSVWAEDDGWKNCGYLMGEELSKGIASAPAPTMEVTAIMKMVNPDYREKAPVERSNFYKSGGFGHAYGERRVPYDNYPALLHEGERVLTASEARMMDRGSGATVTVSGNTFNVREEADIDRIASALAQKIKLAQMLM